MKFQDKTLWILEGCKWVSYTNDRAEKSRLREFEMFEVFPFVKEHYHPDIDQRKILRFDGDLDSTDLEKLRAMPSLRDNTFIDKLVIGLHLRMVFMIWQRVNSWK
jgi:hypothetical protein